MKRKDTGVTVRKTAPQSPSTQAFVERCIQTLRQECLDYFIPIGTRHLDHLVLETVARYHEERPHQSLDNGLLAPLPTAKPLKKARPNRSTVALAEVRCNQQLGGLLKHYYRQAT